MPAEPAERERETEDLRSHPEELCCAHASEGGRAARRRRGDPRLYKRTSCSVSRSGASQSSRGRIPRHRISSKKKKKLFKERAKTSVGVFKHSSLTRWIFFFFCGTFWSFLLPFARSKETRPCVSVAELFQLRYMDTDLRPFAAVPSV